MVENSWALAPQIALALLGAWAVVLTLSGSFNQLLNYTTVGEWLGHVSGIGTQFGYRKHFIDQPAPYQVPFYPLLPLVFVITAFGVPVYFGWRWLER